MISSFVITAALVSRTVIPVAAGPNRLDPDVALLAGASPLRYSVTMDRHERHFVLQGGLDDLRLRDQGRDVLGVVTDVTDLASVEALRDATLDAFGAVHVVCNNAGIVAFDDTWALTFKVETHNHPSAIEPYGGAGTGIGGVVGPALFGALIATGSRGEILWGYLIGGCLMLSAALVALILGVAAECRALEEVASPLSQVGRATSGD